MTLSTSTNVATSTGNGVTTAFSVPFTFYENSHIVVTVDGVTQVLDTDYTLTGAGVDGGGTVTFVTAPANGTEVVRTRIVPYTQETDFENFDGNPADVTEKQFDLCVMQTQQLVEFQDRSLHFPIGDTASSELPIVADRASKYLAFDASGEPIVMSGTNETPISLPLSISQGGTGSATADAALTALGGATPQGSGAILRKVNPTITAPTIDGTLFTSASIAGAAGVNLPHGTAPTSPVNGDIWTTTAGLFGHINGTTYRLQERQIYTLGGFAGALIGEGASISTTQARIYIPFKFHLTTAPTGISVANVGNFAIYNNTGGGATTALTALTFVSADLDGILLLATVGAAVLNGPPNLLPTRLITTNANAVITLTGGAI